MLGRTALDDVVDPLNGTVICKSGDLIDEVTVEQIEKAGIEEMRIRSVLTCDTKTGVCGKCYGRDLARGTKVNIGEAVGVIAAQSIGEPGTQLTMRTFHIGGAAQRGAEQSSIEASHDGHVQVRNRNVVVNSAGVPVVMGRNTELVLIDGAQRERAKHRVPYGARLLVDNDTPVNKGQKMAEWDPYTLPIITEKAGKAVYVDLVEGVSMREVIDDSTGISNRVVVDWKGQPRGGDLRPRIAIHDAEGNPIMLANGQEARYLLSIDSVLSVENGQEVHAGDILARIPREGGKNRDITGGLPRVAELFEARKPKDFAIICDISGRIEFGKDYKNKRRILIVPEGEGAEPVEYLIPKGKRIAVQEGDFVERGDLLIDGNPVPHDILRVLGIEKLAEYLVNEIQEVYRLQGVKINDKHIETIARQMLQKVEITDAGDSTFLIGEQIDKQEFDLENVKLAAEKLKAAKADPVLLGITKASLQTKSFISAASFQETTRVLTEAAVSGRVDTLQGLKENVIVGRLIPAGTGGVVNRLKAIAAQRDRAILAAGADGEDQPVPTLEQEHAADDCRRTHRRIEGRHRKMTAFSLLGARHSRRVMIFQTAPASPRGRAARPSACASPATKRDGSRSISRAPCFSLIRPDAPLASALLSQRCGQPSSTKANSVTRSAASVIRPRPWNVGIQPEAALVAAHAVIRPQADAADQLGRADPGTIAQ